MGFRAIASTTFPLSLNRSTDVAGVHEPNVIDLVTHDPSRDEYKLIMIEERPWSDAPEQLAQLSDKINNYAMCLQLDCATPPTAEVQNLINLASERLIDYGMRFTVNLLD
jgi:hypothetical protein